jgi:CheY-like chemotaxis protein
MPVESVSLPSLFFLAIIGGFLYLWFREIIAVRLLLSVVGAPNRAFRSCLQPPSASLPASPRPSSFTPFPPQASGELILLVEDDSRVRNMLNTVLLNHGYEVITARDVDEALVQFHKKKAQLKLIITDVDLPRESGRTFAEIVRPLRRDLPILFMSGLDSTESLSERSQDPFLLKPFKPAALLSTMHGMLHPAAPAS